MDSVLKNFCALSTPVQTPKNCFVDVDVVIVEVVVEVVVGVVIQFFSVAATSTSDATS